jgi:hypothetical protein
MTLASIDKPTGEEAQEIALNNMFRLLRAFRKDVFFGQEVPKQSRQIAAGKLTLRPRVERNVRQVREALDEATQTAFAGQSKTEAIDIVENVLRWLAYPKANPAPRETDRARTVSFFRELVARL